MQSIVPLLLAPVMLGLVVLLDGCTRYILPITDGFHQSLPTQQTRVVIWGDHAGAVGAATTWLLKRGLRVVERAKLQQIFNEQNIRLTHTPEDDAALLRVGKLAGAQTIVFLETRITPQEVASAAISAYGGRSAKYTVYNVGLSLRGVDVETGEVKWSGTARYPEPGRNVEQGVALLTCHALATAWGFRPTGTISTRDACTLGQPIAP